MTPAEQAAMELFTQLELLGIELEIRSGQLRYRPKERMTADLTSQMRACKVELMAELKLRQRIRKQMDQLTAYKTPEGSRGWVNERYRRELERMGLM